MKRTALLLAVLLLGITTLAYGWGNATHVYLANRLGSKFGPVNLQEIYGSLTPDVFNYSFDPVGQTLAYFTHFQPDLLYAAACTPEKKAVAFGFMSHNNVYGADLTAHGSPDYPNPIWPATKPGWVINYGNIEAVTLMTPLKEILNSAGVPAPYQDGIAAFLAPTMGHDLVETAVDILIKRNQDPIVGLRMAIAARARTPQTGDLLADAYALPFAQYTQASPDLDDVDEATARAMIIGAEASYETAMEQYGQAFLLPENMLIQVLSQQSAGVAASLITSVLTAEIGPGPWAVSVPPSLVAENIKKCIAMVKSVYAQEIERTYEFTARQLALHHITTVPFCAMLGKESDPAEAEQAAELAAPLSFGLEQNYPNPFNPTTEFGYRIAEFGLVRLAVYNLLGQEVAVLVNEAQGPGAYTVRWDASGLPSGSYFYRLEAGSAVSTRRMTLLK